MPHRRWGKQEVMMLATSNRPVLESCGGETLGQPGGRVLDLGTCCEAELAVVGLCSTDCLTGEGLVCLWGVATPRKHRQDWERTE